MSATAITKIWRGSFYFLAIALLIAISAQSAIAGKRFQSNYPCRQERRACIDSGTKIIEEEAVHKDCWKYSYVTVCDYPSLDDCARFSHCYFVQIVNCLLTDSYGNCVNQKKEFSCKRWVAHTIEEQRVRTDLVEKDGQEGLICKGLPCIDGNCFDKGYRTNGEMMDSISKLYATSQMKGGKDLNFKLFEGTNQQCSKKATSYSNCCSENLPGWGRNLGAGCTQDEMTLIQNRKKNLCVYVGKQNKQTMGVTTVVKHQFCCFGNMLDKVIQVEGRKQLNGRATNNFGSGGSPDCRGLTLAEIQRIDFSRLDFSEFIEDFKVKFFGKYKQPNSADIAARINTSQNNIRRYDDNPNNPQNNLTGWNLGLNDDSFEAEEERRLELERQRREAERLENERRRQLEESEEHKRQVAQEQKRKAEQEAEARRLLAIEEAKRVERRKPLEAKLAVANKEMIRIENMVFSRAGLYVTHAVPPRFINGNKFIPGGHITWTTPGWGGTQNYKQVSTENHTYYIYQIWEQYRFHPDFCSRGSIWKDYPHGWLYYYEDFFFGGKFPEMGYWCKNRETVQRIENDLRSGNY